MGFNLVKSGISTLGVNVIPVCAIDAINPAINPTIISGSNAKRTCLSTVMTMAVIPVPALACIIPSVKSICMDTNNAFQRMMRNVPKADVIITNPTHYAVALRYDAMTMHAPQLVAKGVDNIALRIKEIAVENDVPIVENRQLARTIYQVVELDDFIPGTLFAAVAEVLAYVYRLRGSLQR